ncbi:hypothetical protein FCV25MIE_28586, partial [Fagus crenata]
CLSPDLISSREGEGSFSSPTLPIPLLSPPPQVPLASPPNPPLQVYQRSQDRRIVSYRPDTTSSLSEVSAPSSSIPETDDLPIALRRSKPEEKREEKEGQQTVKRRREKAVKRGAPRILVLHWWVVSGDSRL